MIAEEDYMNEQPTITFPIEGYRAVFKAYREATTKRNEVSDVFNFACLLTMIGAVLGRNVYVLHEDCIYPNFFTALIGPPGFSRKTTAIRIVQTLTEKANFDVDPLFWFWSPRQLMATLKQVERSSTPAKLLIYFRRFHPLLQESKMPRRDETIHKLNMWYDARRVSEPIASLLAASTSESIVNLLSGNDINFVNRFCFFLNEYTGPVAIPKDVDHAEIQRIANCIVHRANSYTHQEFTFDAEACALHNDWYRKYRQQMDFPANEIQRVLMNRLYTNMLKLALTYAAMENNNSDYLIHADQVNAAICVAEYWRRTLHLVFSKFTGGIDAKAELRIIAELGSVDIST